MGESTIKSTVQGGGRNNPVTSRGAEVVGSDGLCAGVAHVFFGVLFGH